MACGCGCLGRTRERHTVGTNGRYQDLPDRTDRERRDTLVGMYKGFNKSSQTFFSQKTAEATCFLTAFETGRSTFIVLAGLMTR